MTHAHLDHRDYLRIAAAIRHLDAHFAERPSLADLARAAGLSAFHFNRLFRRWAGVTPKQYLQWLTLDAAKQALSTGEASLLAATLSVGLSGPSRLYDLFVTLEAMTPGEWKARGAGLEIRYGYATSPFGPVLAAQTTRGICHLSFEDRIEPDPATLRAAFADATRIRDDAAAAALTRTLWPAPGAGRQALRLCVRGTNFQLRVWQALLARKERGAASYGELAASLGTPRAARAVGGAVGDNPVAWLIPCHRVLRADRSLGGYRWGEDRKRMMLAWEYGRQRGRATA